MSKGRLLLVEDEAMIAFLLEDMVEALGYEVESLIPTLARALEFAESARAVDAAILDVNLDGQMSYPAAEALVNRGVPVVFVTGYAACEPPPAVAHLRVLRKPYSSDQIAAVLEQLVQVGGA